MTGAALLILSVASVYLRSCLPGVGRRRLVVCDGKNQASTVKADFSVCSAVNHAPDTGKPDTFSNLQNSEAHVPCAEELFPWTKCTTRPLTARHLDAFPQKAR